MNEKCKKALDLLEKVVDYREDYYISYQVACEEWNAIETIKQQLQVYKDKEDKLRELVKENEIEKVNEYHKNTYTSCLVNGYEVLQILNEGSDGE